MTPTPVARASRQAGPGGIGLALAGGGPLGAIYEIGALCALEEAIDGLDLNALDGYVGVSAGSFVAAGLANGMTPRQLCEGFIGNAGPPRDLVDPSLFFRPAWGELMQRLAGLPAHLARAGAGYVLQGRSLLSSMELLGAALPTGLFTQAPLQAKLQQMFAAPGRSDDFRRLRQRLVIVATDLDSGEAAPFGLPGWDHVPLSQAVAASAALPGLFPPMAIDGRCYVDGALKKTLHARVLLDMGLDLLLCVNPLVPFMAGAGASEPRPIPQLVRGGLPMVLSQTLRSFIHSRLELGMQGYARSHPGTDILLFEPDHSDPELFLANTFDYSQRRRLAEHAYRRTREHLLAQQDRLGPVLARHGLSLDIAMLTDPARRLLPKARPGWRGVASRAAGRSRRRAGTGPALQRLDAVLDQLQRTLARVA